MPVNINAHIRCKPMIPDLPAPVCQVPRNSLYSHKLHRVRPSTCHRLAIKNLIVSKKSQPLELTDCHSFRAPPFLVLGSPSLGPSVRRVPTTHPTSPITHLALTVSALPHRHKST